MLNLPQTTEVNKNIPKSKFYEKAEINNSLKESFVNDIEKIVWSNKLSPKSLNIAEGSTIKEIEVFHIKLKGSKFNTKILEVIDKSIPYYILFVLEYQGSYQLWMGYKEKSNNPDRQASITRYFHSEWDKNPEIELMGNKLDSIYQGFLAQISDNRISTVSETSIKEQVVKASEIEKIEKQIEKLTTKMHAEKQFNRQVALRAQIKELEAHLQETKNG